MRKLVAAAICLLRFVLSPFIFPSTTQKISIIIITQFAKLSLSVTTEKGCIKEARTRTGKKCCEQQLRRVDKALSRAGDIPEGSWICLSHRNLILAEDKRCPCPSSRGQSKILSKRPIPERLYEVFDEVVRNSVTGYLGQTGETNAASAQIKNSHPPACSLPGSKKKVTSENKVKHTKENYVFNNFNSLSFLNIIIIYSKTIHVISSSSSCLPPYHSNFIEVKRIFRFRLTRRRSRRHSHTRDL